MKWYEYFFIVIALLIVALPFIQFHKQKRNNSSCSGNCLSCTLHSKNLLIEYHKNNKNSSIHTYILRIDELNDKNCSYVVSKFLRDEFPNLNIVLSSENKLVKITSKDEIDLTDLKQKIKKIGFNILN